MNHSKREELRKVLIAGNKNYDIAARFGYFHRWVQFAKDGAQGKDQWVEALIELQDGRVVEVMPESIRFVETFELTGEALSSN
jgi:hypothetical protein